ncbi:MAG: hypothetical protein HY093_04255 [Candidatus Liptonbacteria bacterium]|nr:hypothetical protein [Candidatus Liptonbacteria bacterium]
MLNTQVFLQHLIAAAEAHNNHTRPNAKAVRTFQNGEKNPYWTHSLWCAVMLLLDTQLPENIRIPGAYALLFHDVFEDTSADLPNDLPEEVRRLVDEMTYQGGFEEEKVAVLSKPPLIQLLKLYDKTATLYDGGDFYPQILGEWIEFMKKLVTTVERVYGQLHITLLARELIKKYRALIPSA